MKGQKNQFWLDEISVKKFAAISYVSLIFKKYALFGYEARFDCRLFCSSQLIIYQRFQDYNEDFMLCGWWKVSGLRVEWMSLIGAVFILDTSSVWKWASKINNKKFWWFDYDDKTIILIVSFPQFGFLLMYLSNAHWKHSFRTFPDTFHTSYHIQRIVFNAHESCHTTKEFLSWILWR